MADIKRDSTDESLSFTDLSVETMVSDHRRFDAFRASGTVVEAFGRLPIRINFTDSAVEVMQSDTKRFDPFRSTGAIVEVFGVLPEKIQTTDIMVEALVSLPPFRTTGTVVELFGRRSEVAKPPLFFDLTRADVTQAQPVPALSDIISTSRYANNWHTVTAAMQIDFPISYEKVGQTVTLAVLGSPVSVISKTKVATVNVNLLTPAKLGDFPLLDDVRSDDIVGKMVQLVLQSSDIPYTPVSGVFAVSNVSLVVQPLPVEMHTSPAFSAGVEMRVLRSRPLPWLRSWTHVDQMVSQAVTPANFAPKVGYEHSAGITSLALVESPLHTQSMIDVNSYTALALVPKEVPPVISKERVPQVTSLALVNVDTELPQSRTRLAEMRSLVVTDAQYVSPGDNFARSRVGSVTQLSLVPVEYRDPSITDTNVMVPSVLYVDVSKSGEYRSPGEVYNESKRARVSSFTEKVTRARPTTHIISRTRVPQFLEYVARSQPLPTPEEVAKSGIKVHQVREIAALVANYPSKDAPASTLTIGQAIEHVLQTAEYPNAHLPTSDLIIEQVLLPVMQVDTFPDSGDMYRPIYVSQVTQQYADVALYDDASTIFKPLYVQQVIEHIASGSSFPDKDLPQSVLKVSQVIQSTAVITVYPSKDIPQSTAEVWQVLEQVMAIDPSLYGLPRPPRKHRVQVNCRFVY